MGTLFVNIFSFFSELYKTTEAFAFPVVYILSCGLMFKVQSATHRDVCLVLLQPGQLRGVAGGGHRGGHDPLGQHRQYVHTWAHYLLILSLQDLDKYHI